MDKAENVKKEFTKNLNDLMYKNGMSRKDLAAKMGLPYTTITNWCRGITYPRMDKVEMLAQIFGVPKSRLVETYTQVPPDYFFLTKDEQILIEYFEHSPKEQQERLLEYVKVFKEMEIINVDSKEKK